MPAAFSTGKYRLRLAWPMYDSMNAFTSRMLSASHTHTAWVPSGRGDAVVQREGRRRVRERVLDGGPETFWTR